MKAGIIGKGKMGQLIASTLKDNDHEVVAMADALTDASPEVLANADIIIDFSHRDNLAWYLDYIKEKKIPLVLGTTALGQEQIDLVDQASREIPVFFAPNYSLGVAVLSKLVKDASKILSNSGWDIEITEKHHNQKADAPSGTAIALLKAADPEGEYEVMYGRSPQSKKRGHEIGMHSLRGGTVPGYHEVEFFGPDESVSLSHNAQSRQIFVNGALEAAGFLLNQPAGLYNMEDLLAMRLG